MRRWMIGMVIGGGLLVLGAPNSAAQSEESAAVEEPEATSASEAPEATTEPVAASEAAAAAPTGSESALISVDFKDADIRQVLRIISLKSGVDIVAGADVEGLVTIKLTNVPWEEALDIILRTYGFTYERKGNIVRVLTVDAIEKEALATEVFPLNYAKAKEVPDVIKEMLSERGRVKFDERTNTVIVTDIPSNLFQIKTVVERLDQRTPQVLITTKVVETTLEKEENLGIDWTNTLATTWTQTIPDIDSTFPFRSGTSFGKLGEIFTTDRAPERGTVGTFALSTLTTPQLSAVLNILQSRTDTKIVSNPSIAVLNNQEAKVHIGQEYPIPNYSIDPTTGNTTISGYTAKDTGTVLTVTPHVNPSAEIVVDLKPEIIAVGTPVTYTTGTGSSVSLPLFTTQTAETQVRIQSGQTIAIGGLLKTNETHTQVKVPILGDIPVLGLLFKNNRWYNADPERQDLLIFLTVTLQEGEKKETAVAEASTDTSYP